MRVHLLTSIQRRNDPRAVRRLFHVAGDAEPQRPSRTCRTSWGESWSDW